MSKNPEKNPAATPERKPGITLTVTLNPSVSLKELIDFDQLATAAGETPEERLARLIRQDIAPVAA